MAPPPETTTPLGARMIQRYLMGTATKTQLDSAYAAGWISTADYEAALAQGYAALANSAPLEL